METKLLNISLLFISLLSVTACGKEKKSFSVKFTNTESVSFTGESHVMENSDYSFTVNKLNTEDFCYDDMNVIVNGSVITPVNDVYTVNNVHSDLSIYADGVVINYVSVTFVQTSSFKFKGELVAKKNSDYTFTLTKLNECIIDDSIEVSVNDAVVTPSDGIYTVSVLKDDLYIEVTDYSLGDPTADDDENKGDNPVDDLD